MASTVPVLLNTGIDLVTPPLLAEPGTLLDSLNYEMSADIGYRRWDGFERRDGYPTGGFSRWFRVILTATSWPVSDLTVGSILYQTYNAISLKDPAGIVVNVSGNTVDYIPFDSNNKMFTGDTIYDSTTKSWLVFADSVDGRTVVTDPETYLTTTRNYQSTLRALVGDAPNNIAGVFYSRDRSYEAINTTYVEIPTTGADLVPGELVRYNGFQYIFLGTTGVPLIINREYAHLWPTGVADVPVNSNIVGVSSGTTKVTFGSALSDDSARAYLSWCSIPDSFLPRGRNPIRPALHYTFINGTFPSSAAGPIIDENTLYYVTTSGGGSQLFYGTITQIDLNSGGWVAGTAAGRADFRVVGVTGPGTPQYFSGAGNFEVHNQFPVTGSSRLFTVNVDSTVATLAGTGALHENNTRYQWGTYNFYASVGSTQLYGVNGVYRAFYGNEDGYSNIFTQEDDALDNPKYLTFHAGVQLGLGFAPGSFQMSVNGVPWDFAGERGALEIGTGDDITGVLEGANDSSIIFGRRTIRRVTGTSDTTLALETITANAGAFDYSCVNVGATATFTGPTGVSTLQQVQVYGDFQGERATSKMSTWLIPKLVPTEGGLELAGVACALPVRGKNQYRLFLNSGDVLNVTFAADGPKTLRGNYRQPGQKPRVPIAWSSAIADDGQEHVEIVWDVKLATRTGESGQSLPFGKRAYRMDDGWGFDGSTFEHWFDVAYTFVNNGASAARVEKVRMYGMNYGIATLDLKASGIEKDFELPFSSRIQPINMPYKTQLLSDNMEPVTGIVDHQNWGFGVKLRINGTKAPLLDTTEPSHICQVLVMHLDEEGANDN